MENLISDLRAENAKIQESGTRFISNLIKEEITNFIKNNNIFITEIYYPSMVVEENPQEIQVTFFKILPYHKNLIWQFLKKNEDAIYTINGENISIEDFIVENMLNHHPRLRFTIKSKHSLILSDEKEDQIYFVEKFNKILESSSSFLDDSFIKTLENINKYPLNPFLIKSLYIKTQNLFFINKLIDDKTIVQRIERSLNRSYLDSFDKSKISDEVIDLIKEFINFRADSNYFKSFLKDNKFSNIFYLKYEDILNKKIIDSYKDLGKNRKKKISIYNSFVRIILNDSIKTKNEYSDMIRELEVKIKGINPLVDVYLAEIKIKDSNDFKISIFERNLKRRPRLKKNFTNKAVPLLLNREGVTLIFKFYYRDSRNLLIDLIKILENFDTAVEDNKNPYYKKLREIVFILSRLQLNSTPLND